MRPPMPEASAKHGNTALFSQIANSPPWINRAGAKSKPWINPLCQTAWTSQLRCDGPLLSLLGEEAREYRKKKTQGNNQPESFCPRCGERISHMAASLKRKKKSCEMTACAGAFHSRMPPRSFRPAYTMKRDTYLWAELYRCYLTGMCQLNPL